MTTESPAQLLSLAPLFNLEARYRNHGLDESAAAGERAMSEPWLPHTQGGLRDAGPAVALAVSSAACLLDLEGVIVDGSLSPALLEALLAKVEASLNHCSWEGVVRLRSWPAPKAQMRGR